MVVVVGGGSADELQGLACQLAGIKPLAGRGRLGPAGSLFVPANGEGPLQICSGHMFLIIILSGGRERACWLLRSE